MGGNAEGMCEHLEEEISNWEKEISNIAEQGVKSASHRGARDDVEGESLGEALSHCATWMKDKAALTWTGGSRKTFTRERERPEETRRRKTRSQVSYDFGPLRVPVQFLESAALFLGFGYRRREKRVRRQSRAHHEGGPTQGKGEEEFEMVDAGAGEEGKHDSACISGNPEDLCLPRRTYSEPIEVLDETGSRHRHVHRARHSSFTATGAQDDRLSNRGTPPDMAWVCPPYYLASGYVQLSFVTDKARNMSGLPHEQKLTMLVLLAMSVCNFVTTTTTSRSNLPFKVLRSACDAANIAHSLVLIMISVWTPRLTGNRLAFCQWVSDFPTLAQSVDLPSSHVCAYIGIIALLLGLVRVSSDLGIDITPKLRDLPVTITGVILMLLIPANVMQRSETGASVAVPEEYPKACRSGGWGLCLFVLEEGRWCACHVLTSSLVLALIDLGAPTQRKFGLPLVAMVLTSLWGLAVAAAGIILGPEALPWPGMIFFALLSVMCILLSKHL